jgi:hypothetical protein
MKSIFNATDIYSAVWPLHFMSRIFGCAPCSLKPGSQSAKYATFFTCFYRIWSIFCIIYLVTMEHIITIGSISASLTTKQKFTDILSAASLYFHSIIIIFLSLTTNRANIQEILRKFSEIDQLFSSKSYKSQIYKNTRLFLTVQIATVIAVPLTIFACGVYSLRDKFGYLSIFVMFTKMMFLFVNCTNNFIFCELSASTEKQI